MTKTTTITGVATTLPNNRSVFVGRVPNDPTLYIRFLNNGAPTRLKISPEAFDAMVAMRMGDGGTPHEEIIAAEDKPHWHIVRDKTA